MLAKRIAATILFCIMVATTAMPFVVGSTSTESFEIVRQPPGAPSVNKETVQWTAPSEGDLWINIQNNGLASVTVEIIDVTTPTSPILLLNEPVRFRGDEGANMDSSTVEVIGDHIYNISGTPGGPPDNSALLTICFEPSVVNLPPVAEISGPTTGEVDELLTFDGSTSYDLDGIIISYEWDFDDGNFGSGDVVMHDWDAPGTYTVTLTVTDDDMATDSDSLTIEIVEVGPTSEIIFTISDIGSSYLKSTDYSERGVMTTTPGVNSWWPVRTFGYGETVVNNIWPYMIATGSSSPITSPDNPSEDWPWYLWTFFNYTVEATGIDTVNTAAGSDPIIIPLLDAEWYEVPGAPIEDRLLWDGGTVEFAWLFNYLTEVELLHIREGNHYANTHYGVPARTVNVNDDGWWGETHGTVAFDRDAAKKFLGLPGIGDLRDEYTINQPSSYGYREIDTSWLNDWMFEGGADGPYDIYTGYEYSQDIRHLRTQLNQSATADYLKLDMWAIAWGLEVQLWRYLEATGISPNWQLYPEPLIIRGTIDTVEANMVVNTVGCYNMFAWKDYGNDGAAWNLFPMHIDYGGNVDPHHMGYYPSPFNKYDPEPNPDYPDPARNPLTQAWIPGIVNHGMWCFYMFAPMDMSLSAGQTLIYQLPTTDFLFITPYVGTDDGYSSSTGLEAWKISEILSYSFWAMPTLSPSSTPELLSGYDSMSNTITLTGPVTFTQKLNPVYPECLLYGTPEMLMIPA